MWNFTVISINKTEPPEAGSKESWYQYSIANEITTITGKRKGKKSDVTSYIEECIERLNMRHKVAMKMG